MTRSPALLYAPPPARTPCKPSPPPMSEPRNRPAMPDSRKHPQERPITDRSGQQYPGEIASGGPEAPWGTARRRIRECGLYAGQHPTQPADWMHEIIIAGESQTKLKRSKIMAPESVELSIPFGSLVDSVTKLHIQDKFRLWKLLDEQMAGAEE